MQGKIFRVAHLGFFDYLDTVAFLARWSTSPRTRWACRWSLARQLPLRRRCFVAEAGQ